ncbi:MAG: hypothetical protein KDC32_27915, partial [Saprospiraceae bacterium]|nr:hypothetical protein [Saprospiraceae bacterium]
AATAGSAQVPSGAAIHASLRIRTTLYLSGPSGGGDRAAFSIMSIDTSKVKHPAISSTAAACDGKYDPIVIAGGAWSAIQYRTTAATRATGIAGADYCTKGFRFSFFSSDKPKGRTGRDFIGPVSYAENSFDDRPGPTFGDTVFVR